MRPIRFIVVIGLCGLLLASLSAAAGVSDELASLFKQISSITNTMINKGYGIAHIEIDLLEKGDVYTGSRTLYSDSDYWIVGIGGDGIADLDLRLYNENNTLIDEDTLNDNIPETRVTPKWNGKFYFKVSLETVAKGWSVDEPYYFAYIIAFKNR